MIRGFVVAGGRSSRMGQDKALLAYRGSTLLEHAIATTRAVSRDIHILCGSVRRYEDFGAPVLQDAVCGAGPIGGLYSALAATRADDLTGMVWLAVDLPLVPPSLLVQLVAELDRADVAMARTGNGLEPLCAAFRTGATLEAVRAALLAGRLKLTDALAGLRLQEVRAETEWFANLNSPSDYDALSKGPGSKADILAALRAREKVGSMKVTAKAPEPKAPKKK